MTQALSKPTKEAFHAPSLDGIRAASFLLVFAAHAGLERVVPGGFGVTVFFFLSGYLITTLLRIEHDRQGTISLRQFYLRRALRIVPPFYVVLAGAVLATLIGLLPGVVTARAVTAQLLHFSNYWIVGHGYGGQPSGTGVYWSLAVEEHFYLLFPAFLLLLLRFVRQRSGQAIALFAACALVLAWRCILVFWMHASTDRTYVATDTRVDSILFGCALAISHNPMLDAPGRVPERVWKWVLLPAATLVLLFTFLCRGAAFRETFRYSLQGLALVPFFVVAMRWPGWGPFAVLNLRVVSFLGVLSYSLYLVHHVVLDALEPALGAGVLRAAVAAAVSLGVAWGIYEVIEKPSAQLRRRLSQLAPRRAVRSFRAGEELTSLQEARPR